MIEKLGNMVGLYGAFNMPNISGHQYAPGIQPNSPGESVAPWPGAVFELKPCAAPVPVINLLIGNTGQARQRGVKPDVNQYATLPENFLFMAGFTGKSRG